MNHRSTFIAYALLAVALAPRAEAQVRPQEVHADSRWIAVCLDPAEDAEARAVEILRGRGVTPISTQAFVPRGTVLVELDRAAGAGAPRGLVAGLSTEPGVRFATPVWGKAAEALQFPTDHVHVRFEDDVPKEEQRAALAAFPDLVVVEEDFASMENVWRLRSDRKNGLDVLDQVAMLGLLPGVRWADTDTARQIHYDSGSVFIPNDPLFPCQWGLRNLGALDPGTCTLTSGCCQCWGNPFGVSDRDMDVDLAWDIAKGAGVLVAVLDDGIEWSHPDINAVFGADYTDNPGVLGAPVTSCDNHGTWMGGIIAAHDDNGIGIAGVAPDSFVLPVRISDACGPTGFLDSWLVNGLDFAQAAGARITNSSFGIFCDLNSNGQWDPPTENCPFPLIEDKYAETRAAGVLHFASAGNDTLDGFIGFPASHPDVLAVAATNAAGSRLPTSNAGPGMFCSAPGVCIYTTDRVGSASVSGDYAAVDQTSPASANAAGAAALVLSTAPLLPADNLEELLRASAQDFFSLGYSEGLGWGMLNPRNSQAGITFDYKFVDASAAPGGDGSGTAPYQTVGQGAATVNTGDYVVVAPATYDETLTVTSAMEIVKGHGGGSVLIR